MTRTTPPTPWKRQTLVLLLTGALAASAAAGEIRGTVRTVAGDNVTISCVGAQPSPGDPVRLGFEAPGVGFVALEGRWTVSLIGPGGEVQAAAGDGPHGAPQVGYVAIIESTAPQPAASGAPPTDGERAALPAFARGPWLGLAFANDPAASGGGVKIETVQPGGAAAAAGLAPGDVILAADGTATPDPQTFLALVRRHAAGDTLSLRVLRFPDVVEVSARLGLPPLDEPAVQRMVGLAFVNGDGVAADPTLGTAWLERAAAGGDQAAAQALDRLRGAPATAQPAAGGPAAFFGGTTSGRPLPSQRPRGVFIAGSEEGNRPGWMVVEAGIRQHLALAGVQVRELPPDLPFPRNQAPSAGNVLAEIQAVGGGSLLWVHVITAWTSLSFKKDRVEVQCYDPSGALSWSATASNVMAQSADHSLQILVDKIGKKLKKHRGDACMQP